MWDIEAVKSAIVAAVVAFVGSAVFYEIVRAAIRKMVEKLTGAVTTLKDEQKITQTQYDKYINYVNEREEKLISRVGDILDKIPDADALARVDVYFSSIQNKIDAFLSEVDDE